MTMVYNIIYLTTETTADVALWGFLLWIKM
jgi:hypothetical protein